MVLISKNHTVIRATVTTRRRLREAIIVFSVLFAIRDPCVSADRSVCVVHNVVQH